MKIFALSITLAASALCGEMQVGVPYADRGTTVTLKPECAVKVTGFVCAQVVFGTAFTKAPFALVTVNPSGIGLRHTVTGVPKDANGRPMPMEIYIPDTGAKIYEIWVWPMESPAAIFRQ